MKWFIAVLAVAALLSPTAAHAASKPNVLFIAVDDLNDWIGPLGGHPQVKTPNLDRLAKRGVTFANAHCAAPLPKDSKLFQLDFSATPLALLLFSLVPSLIIASRRMR